MKLKPFLQAFGIFAVVVTLLPLIAVDFWWIRVFDFPHIQLTLLTLTAIAAYFIRFEIKEWQDYIFMTVLIGCFVFQFWKIYPYTPLSPFEVGEASATVDKDSEFMIFTSNVLQENKNSKLLLAEIEKMNPDIMLFTETNTTWMNQIKAGLSKEYKYQVEVPLENTYGMLLYSKFKLIKPEIKYLVDDSIPSIHTKVKLNKKEEIQLYAVHPTPPMPQHNPSSSDRDAELMKIALKARNSKLPVIVIGDFNDVAWSQTTTLFKHVGELLDVRVGRNFYNTFSAKSTLLRWPLDQIFVSEEFRVKTINTGTDIKSDHYIFYAQLFLQPEIAHEQKPELATKEQLKQAQKQIQEEETEDVEKGQNH